MLLLFIFLLFIGIAAYTAYRLLSQEMYINLRVPSVRLPWMRPRMREVLYEPQEEDVKPIVVDVPSRSNDPASFAADVPMSMDERLNKMEALLFEKNKLIDKLQKEVAAERGARAEFEKVKELMDEEIKHLRDQIKSYKQYLKEPNNA